MTVHNVIQRSDAWLQLRAGRLCASKAADMLATIRSGEAAARADLRLRLVTERLQGRAQEDDYTNPAMQRGTDCEDLARGAYMALTGTVVDVVGFVTHDTLLAGCSPDGWSEDGRVLVELKAPKSTTQLRYLRAGVVPATYLPQLLHQLWITGAEAVDFFSWDDRMPPPLHRFLVRLERNETAVADYAKKAEAFLMECDREYEAVRTLQQLPDVLRESLA